MPIFKGVSSKAKPHKAIEYITDPAKAAIVETLNLVPGENYSERFMETAASFGKNSARSDRKYYHFKFSPAPGDNVTPKICQAAAMEIARKLFSDFECVVTTHVDTDVVHSHIVINSVSFDTGLKFHATASEYAQMKDYANEVGLKYGMSPIDWRKAAEEKRQLAAEGSSSEITTAEKKIILRGGISWKEELREVIDLAKKECDNIIEFEDYLEEYGVTLSRCSQNTISYLHPQKAKPIRGSSLGADYTIAAIDRCFLLKEQTQQPAVLPDSYLKQLLNTKHALMLTDSEWKDYCNELTCREELRLFLRNAAVGSIDEQSFYYQLTKDYGVTAKLFEGVALSYSYGDKVIPSVDLGPHYGNRKEILNNVIGKQDHRTHGNRGENVERRTNHVGGRSDVGDRERRIADAQSVVQTTCVSADGLQEHNGQAIRPHSADANPVSTAERGSEAAPHRADRYRNQGPEERYSGTLRAIDDKLQAYGQSYTDISGSRTKKSDRTDSNEGRDKKRG